MDSPIGPIRKVVHYSGHVQGVGFRFVTHRVAGRYNVVGYVQNLADGRVELVAEGAREELDRFLGAVRSAMVDYIHGCDEQTLPATGEFHGFDIRR